jgi:hypothetical protein
MTGCKANQQVWIRQGEAAFAKEIFVRFKKEKIRREKLSLRILQ